MSDLGSRELVRTHIDVWLPSLHSMHMSGVRVLSQQEQPNLLEHHVARGPGHDEAVAR